MLGGSGPGRATRTRQTKQQQQQQQQPTPPTQYVVVCGAVRFAWRIGSGPPGPAKQNNNTPHHLHSMQGCVVLFVLLGESGPGRPDPPIKTTTPHTTYTVCRGVWCCSLCLAGRVAHKTKNKVLLPCLHGFGRCWCCGLLALLHRLHGRNGIPKMFGIKNVKKLHS